MSGLLVAALVRAVIVEGASPELEMELRTNELAICSAPCEAKAIVKCVDDRECVVEVAGKSRKFNVTTRDDRVRLAEAVRAALLELIPSEPPTPPPAPPGSSVDMPGAAPAAKPVPESPKAVAESPKGTPKEVRPLPPASHKSDLQLPRQARRWELMVSPSAVWQGGTAGLDLGARLMWFPHAKLGVSVEGTAPLLFGQFSGASTTGTVRSWTMGSGVTVNWVDDVLRLRTGIGLSLARVETSASGYDANWIAMPYARAESGVNLGNHFFVGASVVLGLGLPLTRLELRDAVVSHWAAPMVRLEGLLGYAW